MSLAVVAESISLPDFQLSETRLVSSWWLVRSACELEGQYRDHGHSDVWYLRTIIQTKRRARRKAENAGSRSILSEQIVRHCLVSAVTMLILYSWSRQIIEHEKAMKAKKEREDGS